MWKSTPTTLSAFHLWRHSFSTHLHRHPSHPFFSPITRIPPYPDLYKLQTLSLCLRKIPRQLVLSDSGHGKACAGHIDGIGSSHDGFQAEYEGAHGWWFYGTPFYEWAIECTVMKGGFSSYEGVLLFLFWGEGVTELCESDRAFHFLHNHNYSSTLSPKKPADKSVFINNKSYYYSVSTIDCRQFPKATVKTLERTRSLRSCKYTAPSKISSVHIFTQLQWPMNM